MVSRTRAPVVLALAVLALAASAASADYLIHFVESDFEAPRTMKVPKSHSMGMFVPERVPAGTEVCIGFQNFANNGNKGKINGTLEIFRGSQSIGRGNVSGKVQGNFFLRCLFTNAPLEIGDVVIGDVKMKKLPALQVGEPFFVAAVIFPAAGSNREVQTRAPRPWVPDGHDWERMRAPAAEE
jgi:hypothetical protein